MTEAKTNMTRKKSRKQSMFLAVLKRILKNPVSCIGLIILLILILSAVFAPLLAPYSITEMDYDSIYALPSLKHPFGCDKLGRDLFSRCLYGGRYSLSLGFIAAICGFTFGQVFGIMVGYAGGKVDNIAMRICDVLQAIPGNLLAILISTTLGSGFGNTILAMTVGGLAGSVRSTRAMCLKEREMEYLQAAKSINCSRATIMYKHMLTNIVAPAIVGTTMSIGGTIMGAAGLAYIGLGIQPPLPEWGAMLSAGREQILYYPHLMIFPGLCIAVTVLAINLFGDGLRDAIDPKLKD